MSEESPREIASVAVTAPGSPAPTVRSVDGASERKILFLLAAVQFVNILDFMIVMPLGPDFAKALHISSDKLGLIGGSYTLAAAVSGLLTSKLLDRFDRRSALAVAMLGLVTATALGGFARGMVSLMAARMLAGAFGGPATSVSLSILADVVPPERRGKAMGAVMGAFSVASVIGVPIGLELARVGSWRTPFLSVAVMGLVVAGVSIWVLPSLRGHLDAPKRPAQGGGSSLWKQPAALLSWAMTGMVMMGNFALIPYISPYIQINLGYPRAHVGILYMAGGTANFIAMRFVGKLTDRIGEVKVNWIGTILFVLVVIAGFTISPPLIPVIVLFGGFMLAMAFRAVPLSTVTSKVPEPHQRAEFMSTQSAVQHLASAAGAILASRIVHAESETAPLTGVSHVSYLTIGMALLVPILMSAVAARLPARAAPPKR